MKQWRYAMACALSACLAADTAMAAQAAAAGALREIAILHIRVISGEGAIHAAGSRTAQPLLALITDEAGAPVDGATVSFRLPDGAPSGRFSNGLHTEIVTTSHDGRAAAFGVQWDRTPGAVQIRITAAKGAARAGTIVSLELSVSESTSGDALSVRRPSARGSSGSRGKWVLATLVIAGAAAGGLMAGLNHAGKRASAPASPTVQIGPPVITIGAP